MLNRLKHSGSKFMTIIYLITVAIFLSCGGPGFVDTSKLPDTYQCEHMKEICKEARDFEGQYSKMSQEEQKEFEILLKTYNNQCNDALEACRKSGK